MARIPRALGWSLVAASGYGVLHFLANRSIYYPLRYPEGYWEMKPRLGAVDVELKTRDGVRLHAWWVAPLEARLATLYLHGNGGNLTHRIHRIRAITAAGSALLILDYRGYGKSEGRPTEKGLYADAEAGYRRLAGLGYDPRHIVVHGESLGTAVAVDLAARLPCGGVILEAPFTSARDVAARVLPLLGPLVIRSYDSRGKIGRLRAPLLVIHGDRDEVIPFEMGRALFAAAPEPKAFWAVAGAGHNDLAETAGPEYAARLRTFYQGLR